MESLPVSALRLLVRKRFRSLSYPYLTVVLREVDQMVMERVARDPAGAYGEQMDFDQEREAEIRRAG